MNHKHIDKLVLRPVAIVISSLAITLGGGAEANATAHAKTSDSQIEAMHIWVEQVEAADYLFWRRYFDRLERGGTQFPQPPQWYRPAEIVEGGEASPLERVAPSQRTIPEKTFAQVRDYAMARRTGALIVVRSGRIEYEAYADGIRPTTLLSSRSLAKTVTTALFGKAVELGHIKSVDDPVGSYLKEWSNDPRGKITIRQLLSFTSGLEALSMADFKPDNKAVRLAEGGKVNAVALSFAKEREPDLKVAVNDADTQLAGLILQRATGRRFADLLSDWLWRPLGAGAATLNLDGWDGEARTFCCMQARAVDWVRLGLALMASGKVGDDAVIPAAFVNRMRDAGSVNPLIGLGMLRGWDIGDPPEMRKHLIIPQSEPFLSKKTHYILGGRSITVWMVPEYDLVILRWGDDVKDWDNSFIVNHIVGGIR